MRIALVHPFAWPRVRRGGERYLHDLGWYLAEAGHDVEILTGGPADGGLPERVEGVPVRRRWQRHPDTGTEPFAPAVVEQDAAQVRRLLAAGGYDLAHALWPAAVPGARAAAVPVVYTLLGLANDWLRRRDDMWQAHRRALEEADVVTGLSATAVASIADSTGRDAVELPPGVRTGRFSARLEARHPPHRILFPAALDVPAKGLDRLLAAMPAVLDARPDVRLELAGPGSPDGAFAGLGRRARRRVRAATDVPGVGRLDELPDRYATASVTALPSVGEAFGLVVVESLATGTPVVVSAGFGPAEIVTGPPVGTIVDPHDPTAFAAALLATIAGAEDPVTARRCADHARRWDWLREVGPRHEDVYRGLT